MKLVVLTITQHISDADPRIRPGWVLNGLQTDATVVIQVLSCVDREVEVVAVIIGESCIEFVARVALVPEC